jgi:preprotein translocase subunit SecE
MAKLTPIEFFKQVRSETQKVSWPTRKETMQSTMAVFVMVVIASLFLFAADQVLAWIVKMILNLGD